MVNNWWTAWSNWLFEWSLLTQMGRRFFREWHRHFQRLWRRKRWEKKTRTIRLYFRAWIEGITLCHSCVWKIAVSFKVADLAAYIDMKFYEILCVLILSARMKVDHVFKFVMMRLLIGAVRWAKSAVFLEKALLQQMKRKEPHGIRLFGSTPVRSIFKFEWSRMG